MRHLFVTFTFLVYSFSTQQYGVNAFVVNPHTTTTNNNNMKANRIRRIDDTTSRISSSPAVILRSISVPVSELEKDLTPEERSVTAVVRKCGPSVAYVISVLPSSSSASSSSRRRTRRSKNNNDNDNSNNKDVPEVSGRSLGSGSGFQVAPGYVCTNYHVIERAYTIQQRTKTVDDMVGQLTEKLLIKKKKSSSSSSSSSTLQQQGRLVPIVYVRLDSDTKYQKCIIVDVEPDLDLAVLKVIQDNDDDDDNDASSSSSSVVSFGSSSSLLVGQTVVAIGNPFALDKSVSTGVVSALNRELRTGTADGSGGGRSRVIKNVIQTDAAINPGNSGGPLLNLKGEVIGINTAIITTSGSNAGIGFAVPSDQVEPIVSRIIQQDKIDSGRRPDKGWLGISIVKQQQQQQQGDEKSSTTTILNNKNWVQSVEGPAKEAGIRPMKVLDNCSVEWGDAIVAVGGNTVTTFDELLNQLNDRVKGEQLALTLEDINEERRVVYVTLTEKPLE